MNEHSVPASGQVIQSAAHVYESFFVPALFGQWPDRVLDVAGLQAGDAVLDVGCGTGIVARTAAERLGTTGSVTGVDVNDAMLAVARKASNTVVWRNVPAEALPFPDDSFDRVVSQFNELLACARTELADFVDPDGQVRFVAPALIARIQV